MEPLIAIIAAVVVIVAVGFAALITVLATKFRADVAERNDQLRAGSSAHDDRNDPVDAANRAAGSTAWMRPDGGGF